MAAADPHDGAPAPGPGRLFLIPTPLGPHSDPLRVLPADTLAAVKSLDCFVAENAKSARAFLKAVGTAKPLQQLEIGELNEHTPPESVASLLGPLAAGRDVGLLSEAGCPAVADPGANLVAAAHDAGIPVVPLIGPSSLLLALMASGLNGQRFAFVGYLPAQPEARAARLRELEKRSAAGDETILWIETPYRNRQVFETAMAVLSPSTRLLVGAQLTTAAESIAMRSVLGWRGNPPVLEREPTVFGLLAARGAGERPTGIPGTRQPGNPGNRGPARRRR